MAIRKIVLKRDPILRKKSREITEINRRIKILLDDMYETMKQANGVGFAAPQVGVLRRAAVVDVGEGRIDLINPEIIHSEGELIASEGCLSCPEENAYVPRPALVKVRALGLDGKEKIIVGEELLARALCHEIDHLDGILFLDKAVEYNEQ